MGVLSKIERLISSKESCRDIDQREKFSQLVFVTSCLRQDKRFLAIIINHHNYFKIIEILYIRLRVFNVESNSR